MINGLVSFAHNINLIFYNISEGVLINGHPKRQ
jgi:hypothetical protein